MSNYNFTELDKVMHSWALNTKTLSMSEPVETNNITFQTGSTEMLKVSQDGFWVRGVKVAQDDKEAETVYNAFKQFLVWAELHRQ